MLPVFAFFILILIYAAGELVAEKTKATVSATLVMAILLIAGFWTILPKSLFDDSGIGPLAFTLVAILITSMGTSINLNVLKKQYKTVLISVIGVTTAVFFIIKISPFFIDKNLAIAGAPIYAGGNAAALVMIDALNKKHLQKISAFCILMLVTQDFVGIPIASQLLKKEATLFIKDDEKVESYLNYKNDNSKSGRRKRNLLKLPEKYDKPSVILAKIALVASLAIYSSSLVDGKIHPFVLALIFGAVFYELGFLNDKSLKKTRSDNIILFISTVIIFSNLADTSLELILEMIYPLFVTFSVGIFFTFIAGIVLSKVFKESPRMTIATILSCTIGFPPTFFISNEVATSIAKNEREKTAILNYIEPKMVIGGFVTVTVYSVILAGFVANIL